MMDQLTQDCIAARKAGMSYGRWKALQPRVEVEMPEQEEKQTPTADVRVCGVCGKTLPANTHGNVRYCSVDCKYEGDRRKQFEYYQRKKARMADGKV